jgi:dolichyl-phosphate beta-glucosyltransferase
MVTVPSLSVILPAYNESARLPPYLESIRDYLRTTFAADYEVLVVDDGSRDGLSDTLGQLYQGWPELRLLRHEANLGKGAAVRRGILGARGRLVLFADADGATPIEEELRLRTALMRGADLAVGSRLGNRDSPRLSCRRWHRGAAGSAFAWLARRFLGLSVRDSQCGFKMFRRDVARRLFQVCVEPGYLFDLEVLVRARQFDFRVAEVPVRWRDVPGSKMRLLRDGWRMVRGLWALRCRLSAGVPAMAVVSGPVRNVTESEGGPLAFPSPQVVQRTAVAVERSDVASVALPSVIP